MPSRYSKRLVASSHRLASTAESARYLSSSSHSNRRGSQKPVEPSAQLLTAHIFSCSQPKLNPTPQLIHTHTQTATSKSDRDRVVYGASFRLFRFQKVLGTDGGRSKRQRAASALHLHIAAGPQDDWYLVMADDTGIPAAVQVLQAPPDRQITALFEVSDEQERRPLPAIPDDLPKWLYREPQGLPDGLPLEQAVRQARIPAGHSFSLATIEEPLLADYVKSTLCIPLS